MTLLELAGVVAGYGGGDVLQGLDLEVAEGSLTCVVGPNGAGKSTVLRAVSGLLRPRAGTISLDGERLDGRSCAEILARGVVQVPQSDALFPKMTVRENVLMGGYTLRRRRALLRERYDAVCELIPIVSERAAEPAGNLSGGQRRLIEIGRAMMLDPRLMLLDEPSLGLDPKAAKQVAALIAEANRRGVTILLVEQNVRLGLSLADRGVVMERGKVRLTGEPRNLLANPEMAELYLGGHSRAADEDGATARRR